MRRRSSLLVPLLVYGGVLLLPMAWLLMGALAEGGQGAEARIWSGTDVQGLLATSILLALWATLFALLLGLPLALLLNLRSFPGRRLLGVLYFLPLMIPPHIHAIAWTRVLGDQGWLTRFLQQNWGFILHVRAPLADPQTSDLLGHIYLGPAWILGCAYFPLITLAVSAGVRALDGQALQAAVLQRGRGPCLRRILLPQLAPRILAGALFVFLLALSSYPVVSLLDTPTLIQKVFFTFSKVNQGAGALLALPLVGVGALLVMGLGLAESKSPAKQTGLAAPSRSPHGPGSTLLALIPLLLAAGVPLVSLLIEAGPIHLAGGEVDNYQSVYDRVHVALADSLEFTGLGVLLLLLFSYPLGRFFAKSGRRGLEMLGVATLALPPVVVGVALLVFWSRASAGEMPLPFLVGAAVVAGLFSVPRSSRLARMLWQGGLLAALLFAAGYLASLAGLPARIYESGVVLLELAYLGRFLPITVRLFRNAFLALDPAEAEAARVLGHGWLGRFWKVELPHLWGVMAAAAVTAYVLCFTELPATLMVVPAGRQSVQIRIFNMIHYRSIGEVAALSVMVIFLAALPVVLLALLSRQRVDVL